MIRAAAPLAALILPGLLISFCLALASRDWSHCLTHAEATSTPPLPGLLTPAALWPVLADTLRGPFSTPAAVPLHFAPTALFALLLWRARAPRQRRILLVGLAAYLGLALAVLLPPATLHSCDATGLATSAPFSLLLIVGSLAALFANKINCLTGACRHVRTP